MRIVPGAEWYTAFAHPLQPPRCKSDYFSKIIRTLIFAAILFFADPLAHASEAQQAPLCSGVIGTSWAER